MGREEGKEVKALYDKKRHFGMLEFSWKPWLEVGGREGQNAPDLLGRNNERREPAN